MMDNRTYFAYGSNMDEAQMAERCPGARLLGPARFPGHRFGINSRGVATVFRDATAGVHGLLWAISEEDERALDGFEGVAAGRYRKERAAFERPGAEPVDALIYIAPDRVPGPPRAGYLEKILRAAERNEFPAEYVEDLRGWMGR